MFPQGAGHLHWCHDAYACTTIELLKFIIYAENPNTSRKDANILHLLTDKFTPPSEFK